MDLEYIDNTNLTAEPCPGMPTISYAGKIYNTVQIGEQCWLKENLDIGIIIPSNSGDDNQSNNGILEKYCYDNDPNNCILFGGLYQWDEAMQYVTVEGAQGICPDGWHIPTYSEFLVLETLVNDEAAKVVDESQTTIGYTATNETGFSVLFTGGRFSNYGSFNNLENYTYFWSSTERYNASAYFLGLGINYSTFQFFNSSNTFCISVRCLKD